ncbi:mandelate racemase/muconate lactonizing enzyme family protein [Maribacter sp. Asnod2-G09]|uniref:mandelate racemase/muconate lactonizing enzyme family protein n=1 Tax=Maribacter sp. Asnod2-G09 TaxID=3160577 RepID=UPI0038666F27
MGVLNNNETIAGVEVFSVLLEQETPYLGSLRKGETINEYGYFIRNGNKTVYPQKNSSIVVRIWTNSDVVGWGETYGLVAHNATATIIKDLLKGFVIGRNPFDVECIYEDLYDMMRVRGYHGGFYHDALAAIDIALWDIVGKLSKQPLARVLGGIRSTTIPAYVSGLPESTLEKRCELALSWQKRGFNSFKFALPIADEGITSEIKELRHYLGENAKIACDMHWAHNRDEAVLLVDKMLKYRPWFIEAPVATEDINGLGWVSRSTKCAIASGEEWRTVYDAKLRIDKGACQIIQPEMGHTGVTQFMRIARYAQAHHLSIIPHATIGSGIFLNASIQASAAIQNVVSHEYQHSIFGAFNHFTTGNITCQSGFYSLPSGYGIGAEPTQEMKSKMKLL